MSNPLMSTLTLGNVTYEICDAVARAGGGSGDGGIERSESASVVVKTMDSGKNIYPVLSVSSSSAVNSVKCYRTGVNMLRSDKRVYSSAGRLDYYDTTGGLFLPAGTYTLFLNWVSSGYVSFYVFDYTNHGGSERLAYGTVNGGLTFTLTEAHFCSFRVYRDHDVPEDGHLGLCVGSTAPSEWVDYSGSEYQISLPSSVTSATVDCYNKKLTVSGTESTISNVPSIQSLQGVNTIWADNTNSLYIYSNTASGGGGGVTPEPVDYSAIIKKEICGDGIETESAAIAVFTAQEGNALTAKVSVSASTSSVKVHCCGENFLDPSVKATANEVIQYHSADGGLYLPVGTYTLFLSDRSSTVSGLYVNQWVNGSVDSNALFSAYSATELHFTMTEGKYVRLRAYKSGGINQNMELGLVLSTTVPSEFPVYDGAVTEKTLPSATTGNVEVSIQAVEGTNHVWSDNGNVSVKYTPSYRDTIRAWANSDEIESKLNSMRSCNPNFFSSAHRGGRFVVPECTEAAMIYAKQQGFTAAENDVTKTSDGVFVMYHDENLSALGYSSVVVRNTTYANLLNYDFGSYVSAEFTGEKILTFEEWLGICMKLGLRPIIDFKITPENDSDFAADVAALVAIVKKMGMLRKVTWLAYPAQIRAADSRADVYLMGAPYFNSDVNSYILNEDDPRFGFNVELSSLTTSMIETAHDHGVKISAWTNNAADVSESALVSQIEPFVNKGLEWITVNNYAVDKSLIAKLIE